MHNHRAILKNENRPGPAAACFKMAGPSRLPPPALWNWRHLCRRPAAPHRNRQASGNRFFPAEARHGHKSSGHSEQHAATLALLATRRSSTRRADLDV
jgi:hypothetical protein